MDLGLSGLASGMDWRSLVDQLTDLERSPQTRMRTEQNKLQQVFNAYGSIKTQLAVLQSRLAKLKDPAAFDTRSATVGDSAVASATAQTAAPLGSYTFNITQLASASNLRGATNAGAPLSTSSDVSSLSLATAPFSSPITAGTFTVNGSRITIATSDTLQSVFDQINAATSGAVTASYDPDTDRITLSSATSIVLGSAADSSNFLQVARLYNNGSGSVTSTTALGTVQASATLAQANLNTAVTNGGSGPGEFTVNGVAIEFDPAADSLQNVLDRINESEAGVIATFDVTNDRVVLTNKNTGDLGVSLADVNGNFLAATGLLSGTLERGKNLTYTINGSDPLVSQSNTITSESSGLAGLAVTALQTGSTTITVAADTAAVRTAITDFIAEYNRLQSLIDTQTASSTDSKGKVTAGTLANENDADLIARQLRAIVSSQVGTALPSLQRLESIGITANGNDNSLSLSNAEALDQALATNLAAVRTLFTDSTSGLATRLDAFLEQTIGDEGSLLNHQESLTSQIAKIDTQVADHERYVQTVRSQLMNSFLAMEQAQQKSNQQLQFLMSRFGSSQ